MSRVDQDKLKNLIDKVEKQIHLADPKPEEMDKIKYRLNKVFAENNMDVQKHKPLFDALIEWKTEYIATP